jgi:hypothetical protein
MFPFWQQALALKAQNFFMTHGPCSECFTAGSLLCGTNAPKATPFPHRELRLAEESRS